MCIRDRRKEDRERREEDRERREEDRERRTERGERRTQREEGGRERMEIERRKEGDSWTRVAWGSLGEGRLLLTHLSLSGRRSSAEHPASFCMMPH